MVGIKHQPHPVANFASHCADHLNNFVSRHRAGMDFVGTKSLLSQLCRFSDVAVDGGVARRIRRVDLSRPSRRT